MRKRRTERIGRGAPKKLPKVRFTLFCEGRKTEPQYFRTLRSRDNGYLIQYGDKGRVPITLAEKAVRFIKSKGSTREKGGPRNSFEERDQVWVVFDRDEHERFDEAVSMCETNGIGVARSNPCFEVWLILHAVDYDRQDDRHRVKDEFDRLASRHGLQLAGSAPFEKLMAAIEDAEERAEKLNRRRKEEGKPYGRPSTTVGELTRAIRKASNRESGA
ncbi:MAG: RloB family protein [bacterium]|nr:RloB family protein [bacterium]